MRGGRAGTSAGHGGSTVCHAIQTRTVEGCAVLTSVPRRTRGIVHFIGGAFVGALPQAAYPLLIRRVADAGYTVVCTPYKVSFKVRRLQATGCSVAPRRYGLSSYSWMDKLWAFDTKARHTDGLRCAQHLDCASRVRTKFQSALAALEASDWSSVAPREAPVLGIGHSQGSLLHMLAGSLYGHSERRTANVVMSFNNKQVADAVPIPGFLDNIGPVATTLEGLGVRCGLLQVGAGWCSRRQVLAGHQRLLPPAGPQTSRRPSASSRGCPPRGHGRGSTRRSSPTCSRPWTRSRTR